MSTPLFNTPTGAAPPSSIPLTPSHAARTQAYDEARKSIAISIERREKKILKKEHVLASIEPKHTGLNGTGLADRTHARVVREKQRRLDRQLEAYDEGVKEFQKNTDKQCEEVKEQLLKRVGQLIEGAERNLELLEG
jgi:hypothetical protein